MIAEIIILQILSCALRVKQIAEQNAALEALRSELLDRCESVLSALYVLSE